MAGAAQRFVVFSTGHSGTLWLQRILHCPKRGIAAFHEPMLRMLLPVLQQEPAFSDGATSLPRAPVIELLRPYRAWLEHRERDFEVLGEFHNGPWFLWRQVRDWLPARRFLLMRNGIQVVHSLAYSPLANERPAFQQSCMRTAPACTAGLAPDDRAFGAVCAFWAAQCDLFQELGPMEVFRLEDLIGDLGALRKACQRITGREPAALDGATSPPGDLNRKVPGDNSPANLYWNLWSETRRAVFQQLCGSAMAHFDYRIPERSCAPAAKDLSPGRPRGPLDHELGPLSTLWAFTVEPRRKTILVYGAGPLAALAARALGDAAVLVHHDPGTWRDPPDGVRVVAWEKAPTLRPQGVYLAEPFPEPALLERLNARFPSAEIVRMLPLAVTDSELDALRPQIETMRARVPPTRPPPVVDPGFPCCGPFETGELLAPGWQLASLHPNPSELRVDVLSDSGDKVELVIVADLSGHHTPFPVADGGLFYRSCAVAFARLEPVARAVAERIRRAIPDRDLASALARWNELARQSRR